MSDDIHKEINSVIIKLKQEMRDVIKEVEDVIEVSYIAIAKFQYASIYQQDIVADIVVKEIAKAYNIPWWLPTWIIKKLVNVVITKIKAKSNVGKP